MIGDLHSQLFEPGPSENLLEFPEGAFGFGLLRKTPFLDGGA